MRAKPEMQPWVNTDTKNKSSVGAALSARAFVWCRCGLWLCIRWDNCIIRHSPRYFRYSGLVIYKSKLPVPSVSKPCDCRILQRSLVGKVPPLQGSLRIGLISHLSFAVLIIIRCRCLRLLSDLVGCCCLCLLSD